MNQEWSNLHKTLQQQLKKATFSDGIVTLLNLREQLMKEILSWKKELSSGDFCAMPYLNANGYHNKTIAYSLWHIFRIEDIVVHTLILNDEQIFFTKNYQRLLHSTIITTGNELVKEQIAGFSKQLNMETLYQYITEVKKCTDHWLRSITYIDVKKKFDEIDKQRIQCLNVVDKEANWLINYWVGKDIKGLIQMPLSRHWIMHIEASLRIKNKILAAK